MKNTIFIDIDTDRDRPVLIGKGQDSEVPKNEEEAKEMIAIDIACICEGLCELIHVASQNGYGSKEGFVNASIEQLNLLLNTTDAIENEDSEKIVSEESNTKES
jgi:hypothetical protein